MDTGLERWVIVQRARTYGGSMVVGVTRAFDSEHAMQTAAELNADHDNPVIDRFSKSILYRWTPTKVRREE